MALTLEAHDVLLVVDMQNDFLQGGNLAVPGANAIIPIINRYISRFSKAGLAVIASRDWHPINHISFIDNQGPWPRHCIAGTYGAEFHPALQLPQGTEIISKATLPDKEAYSAVEDTPLLQKLRERDLQRIFICGVAMDYCVLATTKDLLLHGYTVIVLRDAVKAVDVQPGDGDRAREQLLSLGALEIDESEIVP